MKIPNLKAIRDWCIGKFQSKGDYAEKSELDAAYQQATGYTDQKISELINGAPDTLNTLKEIADAMSDNQDVVEALQTAIGSKADEQEFASHVANETIHIEATERTNWNDADSKKHTHENKSVLDGITSELVTAWNNKSEFSGSYNDLTDKPDLSSAGGSSISEETLNALLDAKQDKEISVLTDELGEWTAGNTVKAGIEAVTYAEGKFVAAGRSGYVYYSENGVDWIACNAISNTQLYGVCYGNGKIVAVSSKICCSEDGDTWSYGTVSTTNEDGTTTMYAGYTLNAVTYADNKFVAVGNSGFVCYSEDGINWEKSTVDTGNLIGVIYGDNKFVAVGVSVIYYSEDAITWTICEGISGTLRSITYANNRFIAVGNSGNTYYSDDGVVWSVGTGASGNLCGVAYGNGKFVAVAFNGATYYSDNGIIWTEGNSISDSILYSITYGDGKFVICGINSTYLGTTYYFEFTEETKTVEGVLRELKETKADKEDLTAENVGALPVDGNAVSASTVIDYNDSTNPIQIGWRNESLAKEEIKGIAAYTCDDDSTNVKIKDVSIATLQEMLKSDLLNMVYPVGSIYMSVNNVSPASFLGGTWTAWGSGRVPVGVNTSDSNFSTVEKTGGASSVSSSHSHTVNSHTHTTGSHALTVNELPAHTHSLSTGGNVLAMNASSGQTQYGWQMASGGWWNSNWKECASIASTGGGASHSHGNTGAATPGTTSASVSSSTLQPYITCYMWKRTA